MIKCESHALILFVHGNDDFSDTISAINELNVLPSKLYIHFNGTSQIDCLIEYEFIFYSDSIYESFSNSLDKAFSDGFRTVSTITSDVLPQKSFISSHNSLLSTGEPIISNGLIRDPSFTWKDPRENKYPIIFKTDGYIINNPELIKSREIIDIRNFTISRTAFDRISSFNMTYYGSDRLIPVEYDTSYMYSIDLISIISHYCRVFLVVSSGISAGVIIKKGKKRTINQLWDDKSLKYYEKQVDNLHRKVNMIPFTINSIF
jgi:hypothetical protein